MTKRRTRTRQEWLAARLELFGAETALTRRSDELSGQRQALPWIPSRTIPDGADLSVASEPVPRKAFIAVTALLFIGTALATIAESVSMSGMGAMPMPGGWTMSMVWMPKPEQTWAGAAAAFLGMWSVMMVAMMLPAVAPVLWRYRQAVAAAGARRVGGLTTLVGAGYFLVWTAFGIAVFPIGTLVAAVSMQRPALAAAAPMAIGVVVLLAGVFQLTAWKARHLASCRKAPVTGQAVVSGGRAAWRHGVRLGLHCSGTCAGLMVILLVMGVMDLRVMAIVTAAIVIERLAPAGERIARAIGAVAVAAGVLLLCRAALAG